MLSKAFSGPKEGYLYLGDSPATSSSQYALCVPYPSQESALFETSRMVDAGRNANGALVGRMVGRSLHKQTLAWARISCEAWWGMHRWFEQGHFTFYCHFFNHTLGGWETRLFYLGDVSASPRQVSEATGAPAYYADAAFSVIDCGVI